MANLKLLTTLIDIEHQAIIKKQRNDSTEGLLDDVKMAFEQAEKPFSERVQNLVKDLDKLIEGVNDFYDLAYKI